MGLSKKIETFCENSRTIGRGEGILEVLNTIAVLKKDDKLVSDLFNLFKNDISESEKFNINLDGFVEIGNKIFKIN